MEQGKKALYQAQNQFQIQKADNLYYLSGNLGFMINSQQKVEVVGRSGFVYVRLRSNTSEVIQAYNDKVSLVYDLPVLVARDKINTNRYYVVGVDSQKYGTWQSSYIAKHGSQHSFNPPLEGGDPVWVYGRQFMPLAPFPSGTSGGMGIVISPYSFYSPTDSAWKYISTGTVSLSAYKPTDNQSRMVLVYSNSIGNVGFKSGSLFTSSVTGTSEILPYVPGLSYGEIPIGGIRLTSGTSAISWDNIYDLRPYYAPLPGGFYGSSRSITTITTTYTVSSSDDVVVCNSGSSIPVYLPASSGNGKMFTIKNIAAGVITLTANGTDLIDGVATQTINPWDSIDVCDVSSGNWSIL